LPCGRGGLEDIRHVFAGLSAPCLNKQRTHSTSSTSKVMGPVSLVFIVVFSSVVCGMALVELLCVPASGGRA